MTRIQKYVNIGFAFNSILLIVLFILHAVLNIQVGFVEERVTYFEEIVRLYKQNPNDHELEEMQNAISRYYPKGSDFIFDRGLIQIVEISRSNHIVILKQIATNGNSSHE